MATRDKNLSGYNRIRVKTTIDAEIVRSDSFSIDVETGPMSPVRIIRKGDALTLSRPWYWFLTGFFFQLNRARATIRMPHLQELDIDDNSSASIAGFSSSDEFKLTLSRTSVFNGDLKTGDAVIDVSGSSQAVLNGKCNNISLKVRGISVLSGFIDTAGNADIAVSGNSVVKLYGSAVNITADIKNASNADLADFPAHDINIKLYRLCNVTIKLDGRLDAEVTGASNLKWMGKAVMGATSITDGSILSQG